MDDPIDWGLAEEVAVRLASRARQPSSSEMRALEEDFAELTPRAEELVASETGLVSAAGPARAKMTDRPGWVRANVASFGRLLRPVTEKLAANLEKPSRLPRLPMSVTRRATGAQLGLLLGWMSTRVLGQYDQLLIEEEHPEDQDIVYYVGPNIISVEKRYGFPQREFRLWIALHEVTHRAQFTGVPWMRDHFLSLVHGTIDSMDPDPRRLIDALRRSVEGIRAGRNPLEEGGILTLLATPEQYQAIQDIGGLMSLLEGHGDVTMDRAGADLVPNAARFSQTLHERRRQQGAAKLLSALVGLDAKLRQYEQGEKFVRQVETAGGRELLSKVWDGPQWLPSWPEIRNPERWIARMRPGPLALG